MSLESDFEDDEFEEELDEEIDEVFRPKPQNPFGEVDPWLDEKRMCQTEVGLRLAAFLIREGVARRVMYQLAGHEMTRTNEPHFPVLRFLTERLGFTADPYDRHGWRALYHLPKSPGALIVDWSKRPAPLVALLPGDQRLVAFVTAGLLHESRSPAEHKNFWQVLGRAVTSDFVAATDVVAVCVPRSERYRKLASEFRRADRILSSRVCLVTVSRMGQVDGLPTLPRFSD